MLESCRPTLVRSLSVLLLSLCSLVSQADEWSIGIFTGSTPFNLSEPAGIQNPVLTAADVKDIPASFVADPFLITENGTHYMFFEVLNANSQLGEIGYATSSDGLHWDYQQIVLKETFHLSYPMVFRHNGEFYMIPESYQANSVRLYRATNFPTEWAYQTTLINNVQYVDNTVFQKDGRWWMFSSVITNDQLYLHSAENLTGPWTAHPQNPLIFGNNNIARPGGRVINYQDKLYRVAQDDYPVYGESVRAFEINTLTTSQYAETEIPESPLILTDGNDWRGLGVHQLDVIEPTAGSFIGVIDGYGNPRSTPVNQNPLGVLLPHENWSLHFVDSQETAGENGGAVNAFDGNTNTIWHTNWQSNPTAHPHEIQINLGAMYDLTGLQYLPRQDGGTNGRIGYYQVLVSDDGSQWTSVSQGVFSNVAEVQKIAFPQVSAQFVALRALSDPAGSQYTAVAEIGIYGYSFSGNLPPSGTIVTPSENQTILVGSNLEFTGTGSDPDGNTPLSYHWSFGAGSGIADNTAQNPGNITFNQTGAFDVSLTVTDSEGVADGSPDVVNVMVVESLPTDLDKSQWQLLSVDSQETVGENGAATNAFDNNSNTFWHTQWLGAQPGHAHEISIDLGGYYDLTQLTYLPRQDGGINGRVGQYQVYASLSPNQWGTAVATGTLSNLASAQSINFAPTPARYVRLVVLSDPSGSIYTAIAEISMQGVAFTGNLPPVASIASPADDITVTQGTAINFSGLVTEPDGDPVTYAWHFGNGSGLADSTQLNPGSLAYAQPGVYTVTFTATDNQTQSGSDSVTITVLDANAPISLDKSGWSVHYVDSQEVNGENGAANNAIDGNPATLWHTQWSGGQPAHAHELQINLGATYLISRFELLNRQDGGTNGRTQQYQVMVSNDAVSWTQVASGSFTNTANLQGVDFTETSARYVRFVSLSEFNGNPWTAVAEINILGKP